MFREKGEGEWENFMPSILSLDPYNSYMTTSMERNSAGALPERVNFSRLLFVRRNNAVVATTNLNEVR